MRAWLLNLGLIVVFLGINLILLSLPKGESEFFVGGLIGPIPFGFASSEKWLKIGLGLVSLIFLLLSFSNKIL